MAVLIRQKLVAGSSDSCRIAGKAFFGHFKKQLQNFISISEIPEAPRPAWNSRPPGKDGGANTPGAQDNAGTEHEGAEVVVCDSLRALFVEGRMEVEMKK